MNKFLLFSLFMLNINLIESYGKKPKPNPNIVKKAEQAVVNNSKNASKATQANDVTEAANDINPANDLANY